MSQTSKTCFNPPVSRMFTLSLDHRRYVIRHVVAATDIDVEPHEHESAQLIVVARGECSERAGFAERHLQEGDLLFHPPRSTHSIIAAAGCELVHVELGRDFLSTFCPLYGGVARTLAFRSESFDGIVEQLIGEVRRGSDAEPLAVESLLFQLAAAGARSLSPDAEATPPWLARVTAYIHLHARERLTRQKLSAVACMSISGLSHSFRQRMGVTLTDYIRDYRVRLAARSLRQTSHPIKEIAAASGFYDQAHLCRVFKAACNLTPAEYRRLRGRPDSHSDRTESMPPSRLDESRSALREAAPLD